MDLQKGGDGHVEPSPSTSLRDADLGDSLQPLLVRKDFTASLLKPSRESHHPDKNGDAKGGEPNVIDKRVGSSSREVVGFHFGRVPDSIVMTWKP
jgi:hypothetical protein